MATHRNKENAQAKDKNSNFIVGLDIGSSKICAIVAAKDSTPNTLKILGIGVTDSDGLKNGSIINIERAAQAVKKAIDQAEQQSGFKVEEVYVSITGEHIQSMQGKGIVAVPSATHDITLEDVNRVIEDSRNIKLPSERRILHVIPQDFEIDGQGGILDPVGMNGVRLEVNAIIITCAETAVHNMHRCIEKLGIRIKNIIFKPLASAYAVLSDDEKEVGVALVDIGGGTTDVAIYEENCIRHTSSIGAAGGMVTFDVRKALKIVHTEAEKLKKEYGWAFRQSIMEDEVISVKGVSGREPLEVMKSDLSSILEDTMAYIFESVLAEIRKVDNNLGAGIVLTGGTSLMPAACDLARTICGMPVQLGFPSSISYSGLGPEIKDPKYSTAVGLLMFALDNYEDLDEEQEAESFEEAEQTEQSSDEEKSGSFWGRIKDKLSQL